MTHEQSNTIQLPNGRWVNVYGKRTPRAGQRLDDLDYGTVGEAVDAAKARSKSFDHIDFTPDEPLHPAENPGNIGGLTPTGEIQRGRLTDEQRLKVLRAQLTDPDRNPASDAELQREIDAMTKRAQAPVDFQPAPRASQADVREAERPMLPLQAQELEERRFEAARKGWMRATGGVLKPGQTVNQAVTEWSGVRDPNETRDAAHAQHAVETGELPEDQTVAYEAAKLLAGIGGFALSGPAGATALEMGTRYASLKRRLNNAMQAGMSEDEADSILKAELAKGITADAAFNFGAPVLAQWLTKLSGKVKLGAGFRHVLEKMFREPGLRDAKIEKRAAKAATPEGAQAVRELQKRMPENKILTPGQVTGEASTWEGQARKASPKVFVKQEDAARGAVEQMRTEALYPGGQPTRQKLGDRIVQIADDTVRAMKERLRPAFQAADNLGVEVDFKPLAARAKAALAQDATVPGGKLVAKERADLEALVAAIENPQQPYPAAIIPGINPSGKVSAEAALDFISRQKEKLRSTTADWKPSAFYDTIMNGLAKDADAAYVHAAQSAGKGKVLQDLLSARDQYRTMMETVFDDSMKQALRKSEGGTPEDIGAFLWQNGKVSRIEQLHKLLGLAQKEGKLSPSRAMKMQRDVTRGFLQDAVPNVEALARWSETLAENARRKETWDVLTSTPGGAELRNTMKLLEEAAKMATRDSTRLTGAPIVLNPGAAESFARRGLTGAQKPHWLVGALSYTGLVKAAATAYTHGDKGVFNWIAQLLRARNVNTGAAAKAAQAATEKLQAWAKERGVDLADGEQPEEQE